MNPVVGETNDGYLNDIRGRHLTSEDVLAAIKSAKGGPVEEGNVGAGTGQSVLVLKGIGTSSEKYLRHWEDIPLVFWYKATLEE